MASTKLSTAAAIAACDAITAKVDAGSGPGKMRIYDGSKPAGPNTAVTTQNVLAEPTYSDPAFGAAALVGNNAEAAANAITLDSAANASGTATWFRVFDSDDNPLWDGDVSVTGGTGDLQLNAVALTIGATVAVTAHLFRVPRG